MNYCNRQSQGLDLRVDFIQVRRVAEITDVKALVFPAAAALSLTNEHQTRVSLKVDTKREDILEASCSQCTGKGK